ncbi:MAG: phosphatidate cytidylyltransferase [Caulobacteraceae bacterium]|nr:phosphatidate cytidylyltransferase [Caulobacter sp.]
MTSSPPARSFDWGNLRLRIVSGLVLAAVGAAGVILGGAPLLVLVAVAVALLSLEWGRMCATRGPAAVAALISVGALLAVFTAYTGWWRSSWGVLAIAALVAALLARTTRRAERALDVAFGVAYLGAPAIAFLWLRSGATGLAWTVILVASAWLADIAAYAGGNWLGGPKLWPRVSPKKTWAGFLFGLAAAALTGWIAASVVKRFGGPRPEHAITIGLVTGLATMGGDLVESVLKRRFGVKDSGDLIPGHGGLLDRVDGLMTAALVMAAVRWALHA